MKALVVDDSSINLKVACKMLENEGIITDTASSGFECLARVKENNYDVIFMDIMMPQMDGVETFQKLKEMGIQIPVITLTADATSGAREKYLNFGFFEYIEKPIDKNKLREILRKIS